MSRKQADNVVVLRRPMRRRAEQTLTEIWGIPARRGRQKEKNEHPPEETDQQRRDREMAEWHHLRRALAHLGKRAPPPPPPAEASRTRPTRPKRRTWIDYQGRGPVRVVAIAECWHCGTLFHTRRPPFQVEKGTLYGQELPAGVYLLRSDVPAYHCTECRVTAWRLKNRQHDDGTVCLGPDCEEWVPRTPGPGRPCDYHAPRCKQAAYRKRRAARARQAARGAG